MSNLRDRYQFRGKRLSDGEWIKGSLVIQHDGRCFIFEPCGGLLHEVDQKTVGQYTGLTDKNGTKLFEGDVVQRYGVIGFAEGGFIMGEDCPISEEIWGTQFQGEVIGNIHDNPELMGGDPINEDNDR